MIEFNIDRTIKLSDLSGILFNNKTLQKQLEKIYTGNYVFTTNYGRTAFQLILDKYKIKNCKVMIPAFICPVFYDIFQKRNIQPLFIDVEKDTFNLSKKSLKNNFEDSSKCLITNNMNGLPCEIKTIKCMLGDQILIEDCAHSLGAKHKNKYVGLFGDAAFFSLYKNIPSIKGGFAITKEPLNNLERENDLISILPKLIYYIGGNSNIYKSIKTNKRLYEKDLIYEKVEMKKANRVVENLAAFYIKRLPEIIKSKQKMANLVKRRLIKKGIKFQADPNNEHIYTHFSFLLPKDISIKRIKLIDILLKKGVVSSLIWNRPLSELYNSSCPNTKEISERIIGVPLNPNYSIQKVEILCEKISSALDEIN